MFVNNHVPPLDRSTYFCPEEGAPLPVKPPVQNILHCHVIRVMVFSEGNSNRTQQLKISCCQVRTVWWVQKLHIQILWWSHWCTYLRVALCVHGRAVLLTFCLLYNLQKAKHSKFLTFQ